MSRITYWAKTNDIDIDIKVFLFKMEIEEIAKKKFNPGGPVLMY